MIRIEVLFLVLLLVFTFNLLFWFLFQDDNNHNRIQAGRLFLILKNIYPRFFRVVADKL